MSDRKLKYQDFISSMNLRVKCPGKDCIGRNLTAYRWITPPISDEDNFKPRLVLEQENKKPRRQNSSDDSKCSDCGLSMYISEEIAKVKFKRVPEKQRNKLGYTHIAEGTLTSDDGLITPVSSSGHFDLFEYETVNLIKKFKILDTIV